VSLTRVNAIPETAHYSCRRQCRFWREGLFFVSAKRQLTTGPTGFHCFNQMFRHYGSQPPPPSGFLVSGTTGPVTGSLSKLTGFRITLDGLSNLWLFFCGSPQDGVGSFSQLQRATCAQGLFERYVVGCFRPSVWPPAACPRYGLDICPIPLSNRKGWHLKEGPFHQLPMCPHISSSCFCSPPLTLSRRVPAALVRGSLERHTLFHLPPRRLVEIMSKRRMLTSCCFQPFFSTRIDLLLPFGPGRTAFILWLGFAFRKFGLRG